MPAQASDPSGYSPLRPSWPSIGVFSAVMGVAGLGLAWRGAAASMAPAAAPVGEVLLATAGLLWLGLVLAYAVRHVRRPGATCAEFGDQVTANLFATPSIGALVLAAGLRPYAPSAALWLWAFGAAWQFSIALVLIGRWHVLPTILSDVTPLKFLPIVGNIVAPLAGVPLGQAEISWFMFTVGLVIWFAILPIVLHRLILSETVLPDRLAPTLAILISPPAFGCLSHLALVGRFDEVCRLLFFTALFFGLFVLRLGKLVMRSPFSPVWWALTFSSAALAGSAVQYHHAFPGVGSGALCWALLTVASLVVAIVSARSLAPLSRRLLASGATALGGRDLKAHR